MSRAGAEGGGNDAILAQHESIHKAEYREEVVE